MCNCEKTIQKADDRMLLPQYHSCDIGGGYKGIRNYSAGRNSLRDVFLDMPFVTRKLKE